MCALGYLGWALGRNGQLEEAQEILAEMEARVGEEGPDNCFFKGLVELGLGQKEQCLESLEAATAVRGSHMWALGCYPTGVFDELCDEPRFLKILDRLGLFGLQVSETE